MTRNSFRPLALRTAIRVLPVLLALPMLLTPAGVSAKDDDRDRVRFYGWVESMPPGKVGTWVIGGRKVTAGPNTEFDEEEGALKVGVCAKVDIRGGVVHEIDSEPPRDCR